MFQVNDYNIQGMSLVEEYLKETIESAKDEKISKEDLLDILEKCINDPTCPLSWKDAIIVRKQ